MAKNKGGRPTKMTSEILAKLESGFKIGLNDAEACAYADIDPATLYRYQDKHKKFCKQKEQWKKNPIAKAKNTIYKNLDDPQTAKWYLERKCKDEFSTKQEVSTTNTNIDIKDEQVINSVIDKLKDL